MVGKLPQPWAELVGFPGRQFELVEYPTLPGMIVGAKASVQSNPRFEVRIVTVLPCHEVRVRGRLVLPLSGLSAGGFIWLAGSFIRGAKIAAREESRIVRRTMLQQEAMIERVRCVYQEDERLTATMMYGSSKARGAGSRTSRSFCSSRTTLWRTRIRRRKPCATSCTSSISTATGRSLWTTSSGASSTSTHRGGRKDRRVMERHPLATYL